LVSWQQTSKEVAQEVNGAGDAAGDDAAPEVTDLTIVVVGAVAFEEDDGGNSSTISMA
ncbi:hypothetical protein L917_17393, partial [Phytophthora nicotianae]